MTDLWIVILSINAKVIKVLFSTTTVSIIVGTQHTTLGTVGAASLMSFLHFLFLGT